MKVSFKFEVYESFFICELQIHVGHANRIINFDKCYTYSLYISLGNL